MFTLFNAKLNSRSWVTLTVSITLALFLSACSSFPKDDIQFESMSAPKVNVGAYKSFAWLATATVINDPNGYWQPQELNAEAEVHFALNKGLREKGYIETAEKPDFVVLYATGINMQWLEFSQDKELGKEMITNVPKAALSVVLIDVETERPIWIGSAKGDIQQGMDSEIAKKRIHYAVEGILKSLPKAQ